MTGAIQAEATPTQTNSPDPTPTPTPGGPAVIQRSTYSLGGQPFAVRISGDPTAANNGIFYFHTDPLGSTSVMTKHSDGYIVHSSLARYTPFGDWRTEPTAGLTDRGFTGHMSNNLNGANDLGLIYMNGRFHVPGVARFASADTIVPDLMNPQSLNRYTYVLNSPISFDDPSGHDPRTPSIPDGGNWEVLAYGGGAAALTVTVMQYLPDDSFDRIANYMQDSAAMWEAHLNNISSGMTEKAYNLLQGMGGNVGSSPNDPHDDKDYSDSGARVLSNSLRQQLNNIFENPNYAPEAHQCDICASEVKQTFADQGIQADTMRIRFPQARGIMVEYQGQMIQLSANDSHYFTVVDGMVYDPLTGAQGMTVESYFETYFAPIVDEGFSYELLLVP